MKFLIATNNPHKVREIEQIMNIADADFFSLADLNIKSDPEETGKSFLDNARIKANAALVALSDAYQSGSSANNPSDFIVIADDSGLCVDALNGAPGIYSARFANSDGTNCNYPSNNAKLLHVMKNHENRRAHFECCTVALVPQG